jgi:hypothetical protein
MLTKSLELRARWRAACDDIVRRAAAAPVLPAPTPAPMSRTAAALDATTPSV